MTPRIEPDVGNASGNAVRSPGPQSPKTPTTRCTASPMVGHDGPQPEHAGGAAVPSRREAVAPSRDGVQPPAGTEPGNRNELPHPTDVRSTSSREPYWSAFPWSQPGWTGPGCFMTLPT